MEPLPYGGVGYELRSNTLLPPNPGSPREYTFPSASQTRDQINLYSTNNFSQPTVPTQCLDGDCLTMSAFALNPHIPSDAEQDSTLMRHDSVFHSVSFPYAIHNTAPNKLETKTIFPLQTHFDPSRLSVTSDSSVYEESEPPSAISSQSTFSFPSGTALPNAIKRQRSSRKRNSFNSGPDSHSDPSGRHTPPAHKRRSIPVEPGSARAIYLEKNRRAASKCRNKQKQQQEDLVERARIMERQNKALKHEMDLLSADVMNLREIVGNHSHCADRRLGAYLDREADRLAAGGFGRPLVKREPTNDPPGVDESP